MIDVKGIRFLYTIKTYEFIMHYLIKGFNYKKFNKSELVDIEVQKENIFSEYDPTVKKVNKKQTGYDHSSSHSNGH